MIAYIIISYILVILYHFKQGATEAMDIIYMPITSALAPISLPVIVAAEVIEWLVTKPR